MVDFRVRITAPSGNINLVYSNANAEITFDAMELSVTDTIELMDAIKKLTGIMTKKGWTRVRIT
jgi:hypothetical protein